MSGSRSIGVSEPTEPATPSRAGRLRRWWGRLDPFERSFLPLFYAAFTVVALFYPYTGDDWEMVFPVRSLGHLLAMSAIYNGRYAGMLFGFGLMRIGPLSAFVVAAAAVACIWLVVGIIGKRTRWAYLLTTALFMTIPIVVWRETIPWRTGFSMYVPPTLAMLLFLWFVKRELTADTPPKHGASFYAGAIVIGFVSTLFMEHITLYLIVAAAAFVVAYRVRFGRITWPGMAWLLSVLGGAAFMFSNAAYRRAVSSANNYQHVRTDLSGSAAQAELIDRVVIHLPGWSVGLNVVLDLALVVILALLVGLVVAQKEKVPGAERAGVAAGSLVLLGGMALVAAGRYTPYSFSVVPYGATAEAIVMLATVVAASIFIVSDPIDRWTLWASCASIVVLVAPLALVSPIGGRCFFPTYMLMMVIVGVLAKTVLARSGPGLEIGVSAVSAAFLCLMLVTNLVVFATFNAAAERRLADIRSFVAEGGRVYSLTRLPFFEWIHNPNPEDPIFVARYKHFYGLPGDLDIVARHYPREWRR